MVTPSNPGWKFNYVPSPGEWNNVFSGKVDYPAAIAQGGTGGLNAFDANYNIQQRAAISSAALVQAAALTVYSAQTASTAINISLPLLATLAIGDWVEVYDIDYNASANPITITCSGADTISMYGVPNASQQLSTNGVSAIFIAGDEGWALISATAPAPAVSSVNGSESWNVRSGASIETITVAEIAAYAGSGAPVVNANAIYVYPEQFDPLAGSGSTHDDYPAISAAVAQSLVDGRIPALRSGVHYYLSTEISIDPSRQGFAGNGAILDFSLKTFSDPAAAPQLVSDPNFATGTPWITSANNTLAPTYPGTDLVWAGSTPTVYQYLEIGQLITCAAGQLLSVTVVVDEIDTVTVGVNTYRSLLLTLRHNKGTTAADSIGTGANVGTIGTVANSDSRYVGTGSTFTFNATPTEANPYLRIQTNAPCRIASVSIKAQPDNTCVLVRTPAGGFGQGQLHHPVRDIKITGTTTAGQTSFPDAIVFDTPSNASNFASRLGLYNMVIGSCGRALVFGNNAYLMDFFNCRAVAAIASIDTLTNSVNAGENISFFGGNLGGGQIGIRNLGGMAIRLFGMSIDFATQWITGGSVKMFGGWLETNAPVTNGLPLIDAGNGDVILRGTRIQVDGSTTAVLDYPFQVASGVTLDIDAESPYNLASVQGALCTGAGRFLFKGVGGSNKNIPVITKRDINSNTLGAAGNFTSGALSLLCWMTGANAVQISRHSVQYASITTFTADVQQGERLLQNTSISPTSALSEGLIINPEAGVGRLVAAYWNSGSFTGTCTVGSNVLTALTPAPTASTANNRYFTSPYLPQGARALSYNNGASSVTLNQAATQTQATVTFSNANQILLSDVWQGPTVAGATVSIQGASTVFSSISVSTSVQYLGNNTCQITKAGVGNGSACTAFFALPVLADRAMGMEFWFMVPSGGTGHGDLFCQTMFARVTDEGNIIPYVDANTQFISDLPQTGIDLAAGQTWTHLTSDTNHVPVGAAHNGYAPEWATHVLLTVSMVNMPNNQSIYLAAIQINPM